MPIPSTRANVCDTVARTITFTRHLLVFVVTAFVKHWLNKGAEAELRCGRYAFLRVPDCQTNVQGADLFSPCQQIQCNCNWSQVPHQHIPSESQDAFSLHHATATCDYS